MSPQPQPLELWLPDLQRFDPAHPLHALLRKADALAPGAKGYLGGLSERFVVPGGLPAGALTRELMAGDAAGASWLCADPAWVQAEINGARLLACGQMQLSMDEALALAKPLKPVFGDAGMILEVSSPDHWHVRLPAEAPLTTFATPEQALGEDLYEHLPEGADGRRWRAVLNEVQVLLHQHPLNVERGTRGLPPVNMLWVWGGGRLPDVVRTTLVGVIGDDVLLGSLARRSGIRTEPRSEAAVEHAVAGWMVDLQDLPVEEVLERWWPIIESQARKQPLRFSFASGERWLHRPLHRLRVWRRGMR